MTFKNNKLAILWLIITVIIIVLYFILLYNLNGIKYWIMEIIFSLLIAIFSVKLFKVNITLKAIGLAVLLDVAFHIYLASGFFGLGRQFSQKSDLALTFEAIYSTYYGDNIIRFLLLELPFIILIVVFTIGYTLIKNSTEKKDK